MARSEDVDVINVRDEGNMSCSSSIRDEILAGLTCDGPGQSIGNGIGRIAWTKSLPTTVLYEGRGIELYERITCSSHYYLYRDEFSILRKHADDIATLMISKQSPDCPNHVLPEMKQKPSTQDTHLTLLDLGAGRLDKAECLITSLIKQISKASKLSRSGRQFATYCAVDLQYAELCHRLKKLLQDNTSLHNGRFSSLKPGSSSVAVRAICGSYDDCIDLLKRDAIITDTPPFNFPSQQLVEQRRCLLWLGSSFTNLKPLAAADFLRTFTAENMLKLGDCMLIGIDRCRDVEKVKAAYGETLQCWQNYIRNGVRSAGLSLGGDAESGLDGSEDWEYVARWDAEESRHMRFARSLRDLQFNTRGSDTSAVRIHIKAGENVFLCQSYKYTSEDAERCFQAAGFAVQRSWVNDNDDGSLYLLQKQGLGL